MNTLNDAEKNILLDLITDEIDNYLMVEDRIGPDDTSGSDSYISMLNDLKNKLEDSDIIQLLQIGKIVWSNQNTEKDI